MTTNTDALVAKLSNLLKLQKAQRWVCCEWFYSDIDKIIFESENDFTLCINQSFTRLQTRNLSRKQWSLIRSLIGKPRRCSDAFFLEERHMLNDKRQKIRLIQQRKVNEQDLNDFKDIPQHIPLPLSIGHRVYAHISRPEVGVFLGTIAAVDPVEHTYRIVFDRTSIGAQTVCDYEIQSLTPIQTIPIRAYVQTYRPKITSSITPHKYINTHFDENFNGSGGGSSSNGVASSLTHSLFDPLLTCGNSNVPTGSFHANEVSTDAQQFLNNVSTGGLLGGFPVRLLVLITRLNKILNSKYDFIRRLNELNTDAERIKAANNNQHFTKDFQITYATLVLNIEKLNKDLAVHINGVQTYCEQYAPDLKLFIEKFNLNHQTATMNNKNSSSSSSLAKAATTEAKEIVKKLNKNPYDESSILKSTHITSLVTQLTSLMLQVKEYARTNSADKQFSNSLAARQNDDATTTTTTTSAAALKFNQQQAYLNTQTINLTIDEIKKTNLFKTNRKLFEDKIEVHLTHIQSCLNNFNKMNLFKKHDEENEKFLFKNINNS